MTEAEWISFLKECLASLIGVATPLGILGGWAVSFSLRSLSEGSALRLEEFRQEQSKLLEDGRQEQGRLIETSRQDHARQIESLKADLRASSYRNEVRFSKLHERRLELLGGVYGQLEEAHEALCLWTRPHVYMRPSNPGDPDDPMVKIQRERRGRVSESLDKLRQQRGYIELWCPSEVSKAFGEVLEAMIDAHFAYEQWDATGTADLDAGLRIERETTMNSAKDLVVRGIPPLLTALRNEFRKVLVEAGEVP